MPTLHFPARSLSSPTEPGRTLHESMRSMGHVLDYACGGNALCGTCCVLVVEGDEHLSDAQPAEAGRLAELDVGPPHRLACQARIVAGAGAGDGDITVVAC